MSQIVELLLVFRFFQSSEGRLHCEGRSGVVGPGSTSHSFHAGTTWPDPHSLSLPLSFAAEGASVLGVLADPNFLRHYPGAGVIMAPIFTDDSELLGTFSHAVAN